jgi:hypothetical protein
MDEIGKHENQMLARNDLSALPLGRTEQILAEFVPKPLAPPRRLVQLFPS